MNIKLNKQALAQVQTRDLAKIFNFQRTIRQREKQKMPKDELSQKLNDLIEKSSQKTQTISQNILPISLQTDLPITHESDNIKQLLADNQVLIIAGETGCGKTTQLPKICLQAGYGARGLIAHTQPRRVAATSVAKRIADEVNSPLGELVGYSIRFNNKITPSTRLKIMTDGVLLSEIESDPLLSRYQVIIIDEAHERSLNIDFLLGFLKQILARRKELKLIITSATIDPERFSRSFDNAPIVAVEGRTYPVEVRYRPIETNDNNNSMEPLLDNISMAVEECISESSGDILIFADGEGQIKSIVKKLQNSQYVNTTILPLYARLSINDQQKIFASSHKRKIIVSTNVAETSLTVPGIVFVIDIGNARISRFSQRNKIQQLPVEKISRASAEQRKGRCGRIAAGICYRLYSEEDFDGRDEFTAAEIKRTNLSSVALRLKSMGVDKVEGFPFMEQPDERAWKIAFNSLYELSAIDKQDNVTEIGKQMSKLPVDPQLARILVQPGLKAVHEMLIICSLMSVREVRERPIDRQQKADQTHQAYIKNDSDILTAVNLWKILDEKKQSLSSNAFKQWCAKNFINFLGWLEWRKVFFQLKESVEGLGIKVNQSEAHDDEVHAGLIPGFITHIFYKTQEKYYQGVRGLKVWLHPSSLSFKNNKPWLLSAEMMETEKLYARMNCQIQPQWLEVYAKHLLKSNYLDIHWRKKNGQVMAMLNQSLLGLPVVSQRLVNYSNVDIELCRNLFLKDGLASDNLAEEFPFLKTNRKKIVELSEQEQRQRLNNICIDIESLTALYANILPTHICSTISLKRWLKKDYSSRNKQLTFTLQQLTRNETKQGEDYPSKIVVKGFELNLSYCFAPGTPEDGVSVEIPDSMLNQFNDRDFDWLVPGYLEDKVLATIKSLPKLIRRDLIPLNETASRCLQHLTNIDQTDKKFINELARVLQKISGKHINSDDFDMAAIEPHLTMKYKTGDKKSSRQIASISEIKKVSIKPSKSTAGIPFNQTFKQWQFGDFEIETILNDKNSSSRVFQGLKDNSDSVVIEHFPSLKSAIRSHIQGVARLILINNSGQLNQFFNSWPEKKALEMLSIRFDGFRSVFDSLVLKWVMTLVEKIISGDVFKQSLFVNLNQQFLNSYRKILSEQLNLVKPLIEQREQCFSEIADLKQSSFKDSIFDLRQHLKGLWSLESLVLADADLFNDYSRYQQGISVRVKRIQSNYPKEQVAMETWVEWLDWWQELKQDIHDLDLIPQLNQLYWLLEEYRLSLFSPGVKTKTSISAKKLQKAFEKIEAEAV